MTAHDQVLGLVRAFRSNDHARVKAIVLQIAANAEARSPAFARKLRYMLEVPTIGEVVQLPTSATGLLTASRPTLRLMDMVLDPVTREALDRVLCEQAERERLAEHDLTPSRKLLLVGPPGVGKTMAASVLAGVLGIPLVKVQLHATIASHLGETAAHLAKIFDHVRQMRGVYLFDEFDALAGARDGDGAKHELPEMRRVVNSLLQFIEEDASDSLIVAATNRSGSIDPAFFRRFDEVIDFPLPSAAVAEEVIRYHLLFQDDLYWTSNRVAILDAAKGIGHADLVAACRRVNKDAVMAGRDYITVGELGAAISSRGART